MRGTSPLAAKGGGPMAGSGLALIVIPIGAVLALGFWLAMIFYADAHPVHPSEPGPGPGGQALPGGRPGAPRQRIAGPWEAPAGQGGAREGAGPREAAGAPGKPAAPGVPRQPGAPPGQDAPTAAPPVSDGRARRGGPRSGLRRPGPCAGAASPAGPAAQAPQRRSGSDLPEHRADGLGAVGRRRRGHAQALHDHQVAVDDLLLVQVKGAGELLDVDDVRQVLLAEP